MSTVKKSVKCLVTAVVVLALAFAAMFAVSAVASASAETEETLTVIASAVSSDEAYPDLLQSGTARTVTVRYYIAKPSSVQSSAALIMEGKVAPAIRVPGGSLIRPNSISANGNLSTVIELDSESIDDYLVADSSLTAFNVSSVSGSTVGELVGVTGDEGSYALNETLYLFEAEFTIVGDSAVGEYDILLGGELSFTGDSICTFEMKDGGTPATQGFFNIRGLVNVPLAAENLVYNGNVQTGVAEDVNELYLVSDGTATNAGDYTAIVTLADPNSYCWNVTGYPTAAQEVAWSIAKKAVTVSFAQESYTSVYKAPLAEIVVSAPGLVEEGDLGELGFVSDAALTSESDVGEYHLTATYETANPNYEVTVDEVVYTITTKFIIVPEAETLIEYVYNGNEQTFLFKQLSLEDSDYFTIANDKRTYVGSQTVTATLKDTDNTAWIGGGTEVKEYTFTINKLAITIPVPKDVNYIYNEEAQTFEFVFESLEDSAYYTISNNVRTNAGTQEIRVELNDTDNTIWEDDTTAPKVYAFTINKLAIKIPVSANATYTYNGEEQTFEFTVESLDDDEYYTIANDTRTLAGEQTVTVTLKDTDNTVWTDETSAAKEYTFTIAKKAATITISTPASDDQDIETIFGESVTIGTSDAKIVYELTDVESGAAASVAWFIYNANTEDYDAIASAPSEQGKYKVVVSTAESENYLAGSAARIFNVTKATASATFSYVYGSDVVYLSYNKDTGVLTVVDEATVSDVYVGAEVPAAPSMRYFATKGFKEGDTLVTVFTAEMDEADLVATYTYNVGLGDVNGDGFVNVDDVYQMRRKNVGYTLNVIADAATAWEKKGDGQTYFFTAAADVNNSTAFNSADIVAIREALATGYDRYIVKGVYDITGQQVISTDYIEVTTYEELVTAVAAGYPVKVMNDITAAQADFNLTLYGAANINLNSYKLTVNSISLVTPTTEATLKIANGTLYTVEGITVQAPNGNVKVAGVNGYTYEGKTVNLAAYSSSLHIENDVAFYLYKIEGKTATDLKAEIASGETDIDELSAERIANTNARIAAVEAKKAEIAEIEADTTLSEEDKNAQVIAKTAEMAAINVKKAPVEVPVDTHVVVENAANLVVDKVVVTEAAREVAQGETVTKTFAIEVKNTEADVVEVNAVNSNVEIVNIGGDESKVEVVGAEIANTVKTYAELVNAVRKDATVTIGASFTIDQVVSINKAIELDLNGYTLTAANGQTAFNINGGSLTLKGKGKISGTNQSTLIRLYGSTDAAQANYSVLNIGENVTIENLEGYGAMITRNGTSAYGAVVNAEGTVIGGYGALYINGTVAKHDGDVVNDEPIASVAKFNVASTAKLYANGTEQYGASSAIYGAGFAAWNVASGAYVEGGSAIYIKSGYLDVADGAVIKATMAEAVPYVFNNNGCDITGDGIIIDNCFYPGENAVVTLGANLAETITVQAEGASKVATYWAVGSEAELTQALQAGASFVFIKNNFTAANAIAVDHNLVIKGNNKTITSNGTRILNVTTANVTLKIYDLSMISSVAERGVNIFNAATGSDITLDNVTIDAVLYGVNYVGGTKNNLLTVKDSYIKAWGAINAYCNDSAFTVINSTLYGINRTSDHTYAFSTIVFDGGSLTGAEEGEYGVNNVLTITGSTIIAEETYTPEYWIAFQYAASENTVTVSDTVILDGVNGNDKTYEIDLTGTNNAIRMPLTEAQLSLLNLKHFLIEEEGDGIYLIKPAVSNISYFGEAHNFYAVFENGWLENGEAFTLTQNVSLPMDVIFAKSRDAAIAVSGGTFTMNLAGYAITGNGKIVLPTGVKCVTDSETSVLSYFKAEDGFEVVELEENGKMAYIAIEAGSVAKIGSVGYASLQAAIDAAANGDEIVLLTNVTNGTGITTRDGQAKNVVIDFNGKTYTVVGPAVGSTGTESQAMHWSDGSVVTLKNGTFIVAANATGIKMAMQNYATLTVSNMTIDVSNIPVTNYGVYTGVYEKYSHLEVPMFNTNRGTLTMVGSTLNLPVNSTKGAYFSNVGSSFTNSTVNGAISLASDDANANVTIENSTVTGGVVAYFAGDVISEENGVYTVSAAN